MTKICKSCQYRNPDAHHYCVKCGKPLEAGVAFLPRKYVVISEDEYRKLKGQQTELGTLRQNFKNLQNNYRNLKNQTRSSWGSGLRDWWSNFWTEHGEGVWITLGILIFLAICFGIGYSCEGCSKDNDDYFVKIVQDENTGKYGLYNEQTQIHVLLCDYDTIIHNYASYYNFFYTRQNGLWGVTDSLGQVTVECSLDSVRSSSKRTDGVLITYANDKQGVISNYGQVILPCEYATVLWDHHPGNHAYNDYPADYVGNIIPAKKTANSQWELFNRQGERITANQYCTVRQTCHPDLIKVSKKTNPYQYGLVDITGKDVLPCLYSAIYNFSDDRSWIQVGRVRRGSTDDKADDKWMCIDPQGKVQFSFPGSYKVSAFGHGLAAVIDKNDWNMDQNAKVGFCDVSGKMVIPMIYGLHWNENGSYFSPWFTEGSESRAWVSFNGKNGYLTPDGKFHEE
ncbi:MAG: WG repeat-containing protein [Bacteroidaceae bacterium]|nr:WG repeat-containing protein [Bacteroidaceae bacterium]